MRDLGPGRPSLVILFALSIALLLNLVVPPFQSPDEPQHFVGVMAFAVGPDKLPDITGQTIRVMDHNNWWRLVGMGKPAVLPKDFSGRGFLSLLNVGTRFRGGSLYHFILGRVVRTLGFEDIVSSYYVCRLISISLMALALVFVGLAFRRVADPDRRYLTLAPFLILVIPQFMLTTVSVNPDTLSIFLGSVFFYTAFSGLGTRLGIFHIVVLLLTSGAALFVDRSDFVFILLLIVLLFSRVPRKSLGFSLLTAAAILIVLIIVGSWIAWYFPRPAQNNVEDIVRLLGANSETGTAAVSMTAFDKGFIQLLVDSFYLRFGWAAFPPGRAIQWAWRLSVILSLGGLGLYYIRFINERKKTAPSGSAVLLFKVMSFSLLALGIQLLVMWMRFATLHILGQGRYFFPLVTAVILVLLTGLDHAIPLATPKKSWLALGGLILAGFFLLNFIVWNYVLPVFHLTVRAPHPGL